MTRSGARGQRTRSHAADESVLVINPIVFAEVSVGFDRVENLEEARRYRTYFPRLVLIAP
jgi:hypothetical protein